MIRIAIIGAGMTGVKILSEYHRKDCDFVLDIFDFSKNAGYGNSLRYIDNDLMTATPLDELSLEAEDRGCKKWFENNNMKVSSNISGKDFSEYSRHIFSDIVKKDDRVNFVDKVISDIDYENDKFILKTDDNESIIYDAVHLALGALPNKDPFSLKGEKNFIYGAYPLELTYEKIKDSKSIFIIGTGLSAVDILVHLYNRNYEGNVHLYSRRGLFPVLKSKDAKVHNDNMIEELNSKEASLKNMVNAFMKDAEHNGIKFKNLIPKEKANPYKEFARQFKLEDEYNIAHSLVISMDGEYSNYWNRLSFTDQIYFIENYMHLYTMFQGPMPIDCAKKIEEMIARGQVRVICDVQEVQNKGGELFVKRSSSRPFKADYVISAAGSTKILEKRAYDTPASLLADRLADKHLIKRNELGGALAMYPDMSIISKKYGIIKNLKIHGYLSKGIIFGANSLKNISMSVEKAVDDILSRA